MIRSYNELPIGKYLRIVQELQAEGKEDIDRLVTIIAILNDMAEDDVLNLPIAEFTTLSEATTFLYGEQPKHTGRVTDKLKLDGKVYKLTTNVNKLTTAQYIDFQTFAKDPQTYLVELLSVFIIPEGKTYNDGYDIMEVQRTIRENITAPHATAIVGFFLQKLKNSAIGMLIYLGWKMKRRAKKNPKTMEKIEDLKTRLQRDGDGPHRLTL